MRGLFYYRTHFDDPQNAGVVKKCRNIANAFQLHDYQTDRVFFSQKGLLLNERIWGLWPVSTRKGSIGHMLLFFVFADLFLLRKLNFDNYQFISIRHMPTHPGFIFFLRRLKRKYPQLKIILDFPTWPYDRELARGMRGRFLLWLDRLYRQQLQHYADLALHIGPEPNIWGMPTLQISNGIQPEDFPLKIPAAANGHSLKLVFAGNIAHWHGLDRVLAGLVKYYAGKKDRAAKVSLTIIGQGDASEALQRMAQQWGMETYVSFVGPQNAQQIEAYYQRADIAVGSLALHRIGLSAGTPLKHREYCAAGLPFVFAGADADFRLDFPYALQVSADDTPLDLAALYHFYRKISKNRIFGGKCRLSPEANYRGRSRYARSSPICRTSSKPQFFSQSVWSASIGWLSISGIAAAPHHY